MNWMEKSREEAFSGVETGLDIDWSPQSCICCCSIHVIAGDVSFDPQLQRWITATSTTSKIEDHKDIIHGPTMCKTTTK